MIVNHETLRPGRRRRSSAAASAIYDVVEAGGAEADLASG